MLLEIIVFFLILTITILYYYLNPITKDYEKHYCIIACIALLEVFLVIHFFFCYQFGFPASATQDNSSDLTLSSADWLSFLGSYLGFAGSLVMAYLVYRQSERINELTTSEYEASIGLVIQKSITSGEYQNNGEKFDLTSVMQHIPGKRNDEYYSYHCAVPKGSFNPEQFSILVFIEIFNNSKSVIKNFSFCSLEIVDVKNNNKLVTYQNRGKTDREYDPADSYTEILPGGFLKRCFLIESIPKEIPMSWMTFSFSHDNGKLFAPRILVSKTEGNALFLINISEQA